MSPLSTPLVVTPVCAPFCITSRVRSSLFIKHVLRLLFRTLCSRKEVFPFVLSCREPRKCRKILKAKKKGENGCGWLWHLRQVRRSCLWRDEVTPEGANASVPHNQYQHIHHGKDERRLARLAADRLSLPHRWLCSLWYPITNISCKDFFPHLLFIVCLLGGLETAAQAGLIYDGKSLEQVPPSI